MHANRIYHKTIFNEIKKVKQTPGFEDIDEAELAEYYFKFKEISRGEIFINLDQFQDLLNSFGVKLTKDQAEPGDFEVDFHLLRRQ